MKKLYTILLVLATGYCCSAQPAATDNPSFLNGYFKSYTVGATSVHLYADSLYSMVSPQSKLLVIDNILIRLNKRIAFVSYGSKREIWGKDASNTVVVLDTLDMNRVHLERTIDNAQKLIKHPWFFYYGGQGMFSKDAGSFSANLRVGSFLLLDRWDIALSQSFNVGSETASLSTGIMSKYYFPMEIKQQRIAPYLGSGVSFMYDDSGGSGQFNFSILAGVSWALGPGSLDTGLQYGNASGFSATVGYTFFPWRN
ncbi:MAG: hypothetical protein LBR26_11890 [Prevotella sp.]|nr:hypothetical protein [Prevotella sp.]